jgi:hypothetical protein
VAVDPAGNLNVTDKGDNNRVLKLAAGDGAARIVCCDDLLACVQ